MSKRSSSGLVGVYLLFPTSRAQVLLMDQDDGSLFYEAGWRIEGRRLQRQVLPSF
jgi:hypothetical protein